MPGMNPSAKHCHAVLAPAVLLCIPIPVPAGALLCAFCRGLGSVSAALKWLRRPRFLFQSDSGISGKEAAFSLDGRKIFSVALCKCSRQHILKALRCETDVVIIISCLDVDAFNPFPWAALAL